MLDNYFTLLYFIYTESKQPTTDFLILTVNVAHLEMISQYEFYPLSTQQTESVNRASCRLPRIILGIGAVVPLAQYFQAFTMYRINPRPTDKECNIKNKTGAKFLRCCYN